MARPTSDRLRNIVRSTHSARGRVTLLPVPHRFQQSLTPTGGRRLNLLDGDVRMDSSAKIRATVDLVVAEPWNTILPNGSELFVEYGVEVAGGQFEWTSLGYFRVETVTQEDGATRITGSDRMAQVADTEALYPWVVPSNATHGDFFRSLLYGQQPATWLHANAGVFVSTVAAEDRGIVSDYNLDGASVGTQTLLEKPFDEHFRDLAGRWNKRLFFDYRGRLNVVSDEVDPMAAEPVRTVATGRGGAVRDLRRQITREGVVNSVVATGDAPTEGVPPWGWRIFGEAGRSDQPLSAQPPGLSWYGHFGRVLQRYASPLLKTNSAADQAALTWINKVRGLPYTASFRMPADPTLESLDVVLLRFTQQPASHDYPLPPGGLNVGPTEERHVIDTLTFPLKGGDMIVTTRGGTVSALDGAVQNRDTTFRAAA